MLQRPQFTDQEASQIAQDVFGIEGRVKPLLSERDQNYQLTTANGRSTILKISGKTETRQSLDFQNQALSHLGSIADANLYGACIVGRWIQGVCSFSGGYHGT